MRGLCCVPLLCISFESKVRARYLLSEQQGGNLQEGPEQCRQRLLGVLEGRAALKASWWDVSAHPRGKTSSVYLKK